MTIPHDHTAYELADLRALRSAVGYQRWVLSAFGDAIRGNVLEVGGGIGNFTRFLASDTRRVVVAEPADRMADLLEAQMLAGVKVVRAPIEAMRPASGRFDTAVLINVLEHIPDDIGALRAVRGLLRPGGTACILVPAHPALYGSLDANCGHERRYRRSGLRAVIEASGFTVMLCRHFNPIGALGWLLVSRIARRPHVPRASVHLSERVAVPVGRMLERLFPPPFGQSLVAVARA